VNKRRRLHGGFFKNMLAQSVLQVVNGEEEVWMLETGLTTGRKANRTC